MKESILKQRLAPSELQTIRECLLATVEGDFFPDAEFESLFGMPRSAVQSALDTWPNFEFSDRDTTDAIVGSLNNLLGYPHRKESVWPLHISVSAREVKMLLDKLLAWGA